MFLTKARKLFAVALTASLLTCMMPSPQVTNAAMSSGSKFLGNIISSSIPSGYSTYWNQVTPENASKWGSVEGTRGTMDWNNVDLIYNYCKTNGFPFKFHTLVWGNQEPEWINNISTEDQKVEVTEWIQAAGKKYPDSELVDVVNEPLHSPATFRNAIGGDGSTGWDWIVWSFEQARKAFPNSKLLINEYGVIGDTNTASSYVKIINILKAKGLIDGIGIQCHHFNMDTCTTSTMKQALSILEATGLPIYVSELDITGDDSTQLSRYKEKFPILWEDTNIKGVTLWGWIENQTWVDGTYLISSSGTERPSLTWMKDYVKSHPIGSTSTPTPIKTPTPTPVSITYGDVTGDGKINSTDLSALKRYILETGTLTVKAAGDLNGDGAVNSTDVSILKRFILGLVNSLPISKT